MALISDQETIEPLRSDKHITFINLITTCHALNLTTREQNYEQNSKL